MKIICVLNLLIYLLTPPASLAAECIGSKDSKVVAIYLHGMDTEPPSQQELSNRLSLVAISKSLNIGFAVPRAKEKCPDGKLYCWGWNFNDPKSIESALSSAANSRKECFPDASSAGLIGFSNGGLVANQIIKDCKKTEFNWLISIGASGFSNKTDKKDLSNCGSLVLMAGKKDKFNYEPIKELGQWLKSRGANIKIVEFDDGHILPEKDLENVLKTVLTK